MPVEIVWSPLGQTRLREIQAYLATDKPLAAERLAMRIVAIIEALRDHPHLGRAGVRPGVRELVIGGTPYIVMYRVQARQVKINTIVHGAQRKGR